MIIFYLEDSFSASLLASDFQCILLLQKKKRDKGNATLFIETQTKQNRESYSLERNGWQWRRVQYSTLEGCIGE